MLQQPERRKGAWNELVKAQSIRTGVDNNASEKQIQFKQAKDTSKIICKADDNR
jgi:hypothetical protein